MKENKSFNAKLDRNLTIRFNELKAVTAYVQKDVNPQDKIDPVCDLSDTSVFAIKICL